MEDWKMFEKMKKMIKDQNISDEGVLKELDQFLSDKLEGKGNVAPLAEEDLDNLVYLGDLIKKTRPVVFEKTKQYFFKVL